MVCFADINVLQGSVATYARCSGIFNIHLTANLLGNLPAKTFFESVKICENYGHKSVDRFFGPPCSLQLALRKGSGAFINVGQNRVISAYLGLLCASL